MGEIWVHKLDLNSTVWIPVLPPTYHPNIVQISSRYHPNIIQISPRYQLGENLSFNPDMVWLLPVKTSLWNSIKTPLLEGNSLVLLDFHSSFCLLVCLFFNQSIKKTNKRQGRKLNATFKSFFQQNFKSLQSHPLWITL